MALKRKKQTADQKARAWLDGHNRLACMALGAVVACALVGMFLFVTMAGFGASADFIYNQF